MKKKSIINYFNFIKLDTFVYIEQKKQRHNKKNLEF